MNFTKLALSLDEQVALLTRRGMLGDPIEMKRCLSSVNYYRLSGYWFHRRQPDDSFKAGTHFSVVWEQYVFDRQLRLLVMDAVERIEVAVRTLLSYHHSHAHGAFGYAEEGTALPRLQAADRTALIQRIRDEVNRGRKEQFVRHFFGKYGDAHQDLPLWVATEVMSFGTVLNLLKACPNRVKNAVAGPFGVTDEVFNTWLWTLNEARNICAHHGRLWNRDLGNKPRIPHASHHLEWHTPVAVPNRRVFGLLTVCTHCLQEIAPESRWPARVLKLLTDYPRVPRKNMGFPDNWLDCPIWHDAKGGVT